VFPEYYPEFSSEKIITMDWMTGIHLSEFTKSIQISSQIGQGNSGTFICIKFIFLKSSRDPHPGNLVNTKNELVALDFGCMKQIPNDFTILF
jgi:predicted unusual protein kinase regulating ubiquinone biosynthesis (AarF/ABC1/UbiB family)